ncbi:MAG: hypothetical protein AAF223_04965, partial [Bacteroidota bacterium]
MTLTVKKHSLFVQLTIAILSLSLLACSDDEGETPEPEGGIKTSGFVITGTTGTDSWLAVYSEEIPTSTVDLSNGTDFLNFFPTSIYDHRLYLPRPDNQPGFAQMVINSDGEFEETGT